MNDVRHKLDHTPIRDLHLQIAGTSLEPVIHAFIRELRDRGLTRVRPRFYLSTEWGVPFNTVAIAIPFYLASPDLTRLHVERSGHVEGSTAPDILRYLRHEMGHVINYAYRLYDDEEWVRVFGSITQPYVEEYRPEPFSRRHVLHLPGWYAQKHPDEDWAESFAVWMTPGRDWRSEYAQWPVALAKVEVVEKIIARVRGQNPVVTDDALDEDVSELSYSPSEYYGDPWKVGEGQLKGLDGALRTIFDDNALSRAGELAPASDLIRRLTRTVMVQVFTWTGHFPERTRALMEHLSSRADQLQLTYPISETTHVTVALTSFITALAMNHVHKGRYH